MKRNTVYKQKDILKVDKEIEKENNKTSLVKNISK